jgi:hypothetical protein
MQEVASSEWEALEGQPGTPKYTRNRQAFLAARLDVRPRKPPVPEQESPAPLEAADRSRAR